MGDVKHITYKTTGTCSQYIDLDIDEEGIIQQVHFTGGCHGNLQGISMLVRGMHKDKVKEKLGGIRCGYKSTSCPDQLVHAIEEMENGRTE